MSLLNKDFYQVRVSSVLNRDLKYNGKQLMFDGNEETCWCSDQGTPQWVAIVFKESVKVKSFQLQFQGGFVGLNCKAIIEQENENSKITEFYPDDNNKIQNFDLDGPTNCKKLILQFPESSDFFGRIVIYKLDVNGEIQINDNTS